MPAPSPTVPGTIGEFIRDRRLELGFENAGDLARAIDKHQTTVSRWERSQNLRNLPDYIGPLARELDTDPDVLWTLYRTTMESPFRGSAIADMLVCRLARFVPEPVLSSAAA